MARGWHHSQTFGYPQFYIDLAHTDKLFTQVRANLRGGSKKLLEKKAKMLLVSSKSYAMTVAEKGKLAQSLYMTKGTNQKGEPSYWVVSDSKYSGLIESGLRASGPGGKRWKGRFADKSRKKRKKNYKKAFSTAALREPVRSIGFVGAALRDLEEAFKHEDQKYIDEAYKKAGMIGGLAGVRGYWRISPKGKRHFVSAHVRSMPKISQADLEARLQVAPKFVPGSATEFATSSFGDIQSKLQRLIGNLQNQ